MDWIDIGVNLTDKAFIKDRSAVLERAWKAGISQMLLTRSSSTALNFPNACLLLLACIRMGQNNGRLIAINS